MRRTVRDVMMPEPWTIDARTSLEDTAHQMRGWKTQEILVTNQGELLGRLSDRDIIVLAIASGRAPTEVTAGESCDPDVQRLDADTDIHEALQFMRHHDLRHLPVVDGRQLVGTVWVVDLAIAAAETRSQPAAV
jgi:CBS domain-containing protein